jgi:hypothetical protein
MCLLRSLQMLDAWRSMFVRSADKGRDDGDCDICLASHCVLTAEIESASLSASDLLRLASVVSVGGEFSD